MIAFGSVISRMTASEVMLLPDPDSPTMLRISRWPTVKDTFSRMRMMPRSERKETQRSRTSSSVSPVPGGGVAAAEDGTAISAGIAHPRIEPGIGDVDDRVGDHDEEG